MSRKWVKKIVPREDSNVSEIEIDETGERMRVRFREDSEEPKPPPPPTFISTRLIARGSRNYLVFLRVRTM